MIWYRWKLWRLAWACGAPGENRDRDGRWVSLGNTRLYWLREARRV